MPAFTKICLYFLIVLVGISCFMPSFRSLSEVTQSTYVREEDSAIFIGNAFVEVGFRKDTGALWSILHRASGVDLRGLKGDLEEGLWDLKLLTDELEHVGLSGINMSHRYYQGYSVKQTAGEVQITLEWSRIWLQDYGEYPARVLAMVEISESQQQANFSLFIENHGSAAIEEVCYPCIWGISKLGENSSDDILILPEQKGRLFLNPSENLNWWSQIYPSGFLSMQFAAYYDNNSGFHIAAYDQDANVKSFSWEKRDNSGIRFGITHYPTIKFGAPFILDYDVVLGIFTGDWYTAADIYKGWARRQWWARRKDTSPWLREIGVCKDFTCYSAERNRTFDECIQRTRQHQDYFNLPTLLNLQGWEEKGALSYGSYFPPIEGWEKFDEVVNEAHEVDTKIWAHIGAFSIITESEQWKNGTARPHAMIREDGSPISSVTKWEYVDMCPFTEYWRKSLKDYISTLARHGVDAIQFDGFPLVPPEPCYNASHSHPLGLGGNWYAESWNRILEDAENEARSINPDIVFSGEGMAEVFIPFLDIENSRDSWAEVFDFHVHNGTATVIPLFNYVYNECLLFAGEHKLALWKPLGGSSYNRLGLARILVWGELPIYNMQEDLNDPDVDSVLIDYLARIGHARTTYAQKFLSYSTPLNPVEIRSPLEQMQDEAGSLYNVSSIQYNAWMADDGSIGYVLTNIADEKITVEQEVNVTIPLPCLSYLVRDGNLEWTDILTSADHDLVLQMEPLEIVLLAFTPVDTVPPDATAGYNLTVPEDTLVQFDGSSSWDNVWIVDYAWTFEDGGKSIILDGVSPAYIFSTPGNYFVHLNVTDATGNRDTDTILITVLDVTDPVARAGSDLTVKVGENLIFDASGSTDNVGIVSYEWDLGEGTTETFPIVTYAYTEPGDYTVTLKVSDRAGNSATDTITIIVEEEEAEAIEEKGEFLRWMLVGGRWILVVIVVAFLLGMIPYLLVKTSK